MQNLYAFIDWRGTQIATIVSSLHSLQEIYQALLYVNSKMAGSNVVMYGWGSAFVDVFKFNNS